MGIALTIASIMLIICATIIIVCYLFLCSENEVKMFANPRYEERIQELEKTVEEMKKGANVK